MKIRSDRGHRSRGVRRHILIIRLKGLEGHQSGVTWNNDVILGDGDPRLTCHVSPGFICLVDPIGPLKRDMCHLYRIHVSYFPYRMSLLAPAYLIHLAGGVLGTHLSLPPCLVPHHVRGWTLQESGTLGLHKCGVKY
jgi:hypothetical protein